MEKLILDALKDKENAKQKLTAALFHDIMVNELGFVPEGDFDISLGSVQRYRNARGDRISVRIQELGDSLVFNMVKNDDGDSLKSFHIKPGKVKINEGKLGGTFKREELFPDSRFFVEKIRANAAIFQKTPRVAKPPRERKAPMDFSSLLDDDDGFDPLFGIPSNRPLKNPLEGDLVGPNNPIFGLKKKKRQERYYPMGPVNLNNDAMKPPKMPRTDLDDPSYFF